MLRKILRHEAYALAADRTVWVVLFLFVAAAALALTSGGGRVAERQEEIGRTLEREAADFRAFQAEVRALEEQGVQPDPKARLFTAGPNHPFRPGYWKGRTAFLAPEPLAPLALGRSALEPHGVRVTTAARDTLTTLESLDNPLYLAAGSFDLAFVLIYLYPLLILALSFNLVSGEKEGGTLALLLSQPVTLGRLMLGKVAVRAALVAGLAVLAPLAAALAFRLDLGDARVQLDLLLWIAGTLAYGAFWFALALWVASRGRSSATNALALTGLWLALVVLLPAVLNLGIAVAYPVPSRAEQVTASRRAAEDVELASSRELGRFFQDHPELAAPPSLDDPDKVSFLVQIQSRENGIARALAPVSARYRTQLDHQQRWAGRLRYLTPAALYQGVLLEAAGTGASRHRRFREQVDAYHRAWLDFFLPRYLLEVPVLRATDYDRMPRFTLEEESPAATLRRLAGPFLVLAAFSAVLLALGLRGLRRYSVAG